MSSIDEAVRRILRVKMKLGLFENPYVDVVPEEERYILPEYLKVAEQLAAESMVLLKNENETLPISSKYKKLASSWTYGKRFGKHHGLLGRKRKIPKM